MSAQPSATVCTIATLRELANVRVLSQMLRQTGVEPLHALLLDDVEEEDPSAESFEVLRPEALDVGDFVEMALRLAERPLRAALLPDLIRVLLDAGDDRPVLFLSPDRIVCTELSPLVEGARAGGVALVPRMREPVPGGERVAAAAMISAPVFDHGCFAIAQTDRTLELLVVAQAGMSAGQPEEAHWLDHAISLIPATVVLRDPGISVGPWNLHERRVQMVRGEPCVGELPLRTLSLPDFDPRDRSALGGSLGVAELCSDYAGALIAAGWDELSGRSYGLERNSQRIVLNHVTLPELDAARAAGVVRSSPFSLRGYEEFIAWLGAPTPMLPGGGISRFWWRVYTERTDLQSAFPDVRTGEVGAFLEWAAEHGRREMDAPDALGTEPTQLEAAASSSSASQT
jgi:hypothetical protein